MTSNFQKIAEEATDAPKDDLIREEARSAVDYANRVSAREIDGTSGMQILSTAAALGLHFDQLDKTASCGNPDIKDGEPISLDDKRAAFENGVIGVGTGLAVIALSEAHRGVATDVNETCALLVKTIKENAARLEALSQFLTREEAPHPTNKGASVISVGLDHEKLEAAPEDVQQKAKHAWSTLSAVETAGKQALLQIALSGTLPPIDLH